MESVIDSAIISECIKNLWVYIIKDARNVNIRIIFWASPWAMFLYKASVASDCEFNMSDVDSTFISTSTISEVHVEQVHI